ncbi:tyrosine-type recombinase/integrase [Cupriavidus metallidurans]|uniref:tyrosine-type recombinase/integrase n=1 Tax=Cupriavidus metallidurans TaxID=119219 RepID=UPI00068EB8F8|nr:tyrosine-type recombinase/integrase [Cupriavidus metallidurans]
MASKKREEKGAANKDVRHATATRRRGPGAPIPPARYLGAQHFAFFKGVIEGLDLAELGERYLETGADRRAAVAEVRMIEAELLRGVRRLQSERDRSESTDEPADMPDEAAWQELFSVMGVHSGGQRKRLARQLAALDLVRPYLARTPAPEDSVAAWFSPAVAARLARAGLVTLRDLKQQVVMRGPRWYAVTHGVGPTTGRRLTAWLVDAGSSLGDIPPAALVSRRTASRETLASLRPAAVMVAPLESLQLPAAYDGRDGHNRPPRGTVARTAAQNDLGAIRAWLGVHGPEGSATWKTYRCHAERLLLWAVFARGKALSDLTVEDCSAFLDFLADPQPAERWVGPRGVPRFRYDWRPFAGPLSPSSIRQSYTVVSNLCQWLVDAQYLRYNPFALLPKPKTARTRIQISRSFTKSQWAFLQRHAAELPTEDPRSMRLQFMLRFAYATGLRISEQARATVGQLVHHDHPDDPRGTWSLVFIGKGTIEREVHVSHAVIWMLMRYLKNRGLSDENGRLHAATPLIGRVKPDGKVGNLSVDQIHAIYKRFFADAARAMESDDPEGALRLASASAHWLRHSFGNHAVAHGVALDVVQSQLGHASLATTSVYVRAEAERRAQELERTGLF